MINLCKSDHSLYVSYVQQMGRILSKSVLHCRLVNKWLTVYNIIRKTIFIEH